MDTTTPAPVPPPAPGSEKAPGGSNSSSQFWSPSRIVGLVFCSLGAMLLVSFYNQTHTQQAIFRQALGQGNPPSVVILFMIGFYSVLVGISLVAGVARFLNRKGVIVFFILLIVVFWFAWIPFLIPSMKAKR
jgi:hypothetical protein